MADIQVPNRQAPNFQFQGAPVGLIDSLYNRKTDLENLADTASSISGNYLKEREADKQRALAAELQKAQIREANIKSQTGLLDSLPQNQANQAATNLYSKYFGSLPAQPMQQSPSSQFTPLEAQNQQSIPSEHPETIQATLDHPTLGQHISDNPDLFPDFANMSRKGEERFGKELLAKKNILDLSPKKYVSRSELPGRGGVIQPNEQLLPSENRDWNITTDPTTGKRIIVDKMTGEVKPVTGLGSGPMSEFTPNQLKIIDETTKSYGQDDIVNGSRINLSQINQLKQLLNSGNPAAPGPFRSNAARVIAGEKGVLTDRDVTRNTGSESYGAQFNRFIRKAADGQFTDQDKNDFNKLLTLVEKASRNRLDTVTSNYTKRASLRSGISDESRIRSMIELPSNFNEGPQSGSNALTPEEQDEFAKLDAKYGGK